MHEEEWITQEAAALRLNISLDAMRRYVRQGKFPRTRVGKRYLIPVSAIDDYLKEWITQEKAAERLHVALDTMRRYVREGRFPYKRVGKRYLVPARAISEYLKKGLEYASTEVRPRSAKRPR